MQVAWNKCAWSVALFCWRAGLGRGVLARHSDEDRNIVPCRVTPCTQRTRAEDFGSRKIAAYESLSHEEGANWTEPVRRDGSVRGLEDWAPRGRGAGEIVAARLGYCEMIM